MQRSYGLMIRIGEILNQDIYIRVLRRAALLLLLSKICLQYYNM